MCAAPRLKRQAVLAALTADVAARAAFFAVPVAVAKAILSVPTPGAVVGAHAAIAALPTAVAKKARTVNGAPAPVANTSKTLVAREAKATKECALATAYMAAPAEVVVAPMPVAKAPGPFHSTGVVVEILGTERGDQGRSCEEHISNCGEVMAKDMVVHLRKVQIQVEGWEETVIAAYWVTDGVNCCCVGFLPCHMVRHTTHYNGVQVTHIFNADPTCCNTAEHRAFHKNKGCCLVAIIAW